MTAFRDALPVIYLVGGILLAGALLDLIFGTY